MRFIAYTQQYQKKCFDTWYLNGRPNIKRLLEIVPKDELGRIPSPIVARRWRENGMWDEWADSLDVKAIEKSDKVLVNKKAQMLIRHQESAEKLAVKALSYLEEEGFDSSASAVQAYFKATEEQRKTAGFSDLLERLDNMTNNDVEREIIEKLNRIRANDQIIEVDAIESGEENKDDTE